MEELPPRDWRDRERAHAARVDTLVAQHLARREWGRKHPVEDFLWVYYRHRPGQLRRWHPRPDVVLRGENDPRGRRSWRYYRALGDGVAVDVAGFLAARGQSVRWLRGLLRATADRPAFLSCFGLHEWAMVYGLSHGERRHEDLPLRLSQADTDAVVAASQIRCSHADAYRFFTPAAVPRNQLRPTRATQADHEQPGCLHATMDLYKWAFKLTPAVPSELVLSCLDLAVDARRLDMAASPYDVRAYGLDPVRVETPQGRAQYVVRQRALAARGAELRTRLLNACEELLSGS